MGQLIILALLAVPPASTVRGRVVWAGPVPAVADIPAAIPEPSGFRFTGKPNPFAPQVTDGGLAGAVVSLVGVTGTKPWPFAAVTVEQAGHVLRVRQGEATGRVGIVRLGEAVTLVSRDLGPTIIRIRGADFASLPFPGPDKPTVRTLSKPGVVEVTSGAMLSWAASDLVVSDHPYHAVTDAAGRFELTQVPPGEYKLVCRVRDWREIGHDRDPETGLIARRRFAPPLVLEVTVRAPGEHIFTVASTSFPAR